MSTCFGKLSIHSGGAGNQVGISENRVRPDPIIS